MSQSNDHMNVEFNCIGCGKIDLFKVCKECIEEQIQQQPMIYYYSEIVPVFNYIRERPKYDMYTYTYTKTNDQITDVQLKYHRPNIDKVYYHYNENYDNQSKYGYMYTDNLPQWTITGYNNGYHYYKTSKDYFRYYGSIEKDINKATDTTKESQ